MYDSPLVIMSAYLPQANTVAQEILTMSTEMKEDSLSIQVEVDLLLILLRRIGDSDSELR